jgi:hypothetical protein
MKKVADTYHLSCRGGVWYYRRRVPQHLVQSLGRRFIQYSLATTSKAEAKKLRSIADLNAEALFEKHLSASHQVSASGAAGPASQTVGAAELLGHVRAYVERGYRRCGDELLNDPPGSRQELHEMAVEADEAISVLRDPVDPRCDEMISWAGDKILAVAGAKLNDTGPAYAEFAALVRRGLIELNRRKLAHYTDQFDRTFFDALFDPTASTSVT